ncbi:Uncharacterized [Moorella glycerini]|uniref:Uncharacterized protein n=1 Tax=Neomoorella stamsii TaxID=1266720 RepID=A0A9X7J5M5_9FIRM|nr:hypothetical protein MOST_01190 [Moorella stamsii]CEP68535.1 Uncharacterized [Moorella glycerini]
MVAGFAPLENMASRQVLTIAVKLLPVFPAFRRAPEIQVGQLHPGEDKVFVVDGIVAVDVHHHADNKGFPLLVVIKLGGDVAGKIPFPQVLLFFPAGFAPQVADEGAPSLVVGRRIEADLPLVGHQEDLQGVDDGGLAGAVATGNEGLAAELG